MEVRCCMVVGGIFTVRFDSPNIAVLTWPIKFGAYFISSLTTSVTDRHSKQVATKAGRWYVFVCYCQKEKNPFVKFGTVTIAMLSSMISESILGVQFAKRVFPFGHRSNA